MIFINMKICATCKQEKNILDFNKNKTKSDGYQSICRKCSNINSKKHYISNPKKHRKCSNINSKKHYISNPKKHRKLVEERKREITEWIRNKKSTLRCEKCQESHIACLQFHHINSEIKEFELGEAGRNGYSIKKIEEEIAKCMVLCVNCHFKLHWKEKLMLLSTKCVNDDAF